MYMDYYSNEQICEVNYYLKDELGVVLFLCLSELDEVGPLDAAEEKGPADQEEEPDDDREDRDRDFEACAAPHPSRRGLLIPSLLPARIFASRDRRLSRLLAHPGNEVDFAT